MDKEIKKLADEISLKLLATRKHPDYEWLKTKLKHSFKTLKNHSTKDYCHYSDLPSPSAYTENTNYNKK